MSIRHNRKNNRLQGYDYSQGGAYFVTICARNREELFGAVNNDMVILNEYGKIANQTWLEIPEHFPNVGLDKFIVMPNHIHGVIYVVGGADLRPLQNNGRSKMILSTVIHGFKSSATRKIRIEYNNTDYIWQRSFYDHIIRNEKSLYKIREYIINNPIAWPEDAENIQS